MSRSCGSKFDFLGITGFFGGDVALSAIETLHTYQDRRRLGWYNQPGSYLVAKRYAQLSRWRFWTILFTGADVGETMPPSGFGQADGPKFTGSQSGIRLAKTGLIAHLLAEQCKSLPVSVISPHQRVTTAGFVTVVHLAEWPAHHEEAQRAKVSSTTRQGGKTTSIAILAFIPIITSFGALAGCAIIHDWPCLAIILLGILCNGVSCLVMGGVTLTFQRANTFPNAPPGSGMLELNGGTELVILKGPEEAVSAVTRGRFIYAGDSKDRDKYRDSASVCSMLHALQFLAQLFLLPLCSLYGQLFFLATVIHSWMYNYYLYVLGIERVILRDQSWEIQPGQVEKYQLGTRTMMVTFALLLLAPGRRQVLEGVLVDLLPNDTQVWTAWKTEVLRCIEMDFHDGRPDFEFEFRKDTSLPLKERERELLRALFGDAAAAAEMYREYRRRLGSKATGLESDHGMKTTAGRAVEVLE